MDVKEGLITSLKFGAVFGAALVHLELNIDLLGDVRNCIKAVYDFFQSGPDAGTKLYNILQEARSNGQINEDSFSHLDPRNTVSGIAPYSTSARHTLIKMF